MPWRQQSRNALSRDARMTRQRCAQKTSSYITARPWLPGLIVGPCPSEESLCCPACPSLSPPPFFFSPILGPRSLKLRVSFPCIFSPPVCIIRSVTSLSLATNTWSPEHPFFSTHCYPNTSSDVSLGEASSRLRHTVFPPEGLLLSGQGGCSRRPYQGYYIKGLSSHLTSGSKIRLTAGFEPCPQGPASSSLAAVHSPF